MKILAQYNKLMQHILYILLFCTSNLSASNAKNKVEKLTTSFTIKYNCKSSRSHFDKKNSDILIVSLLGNNGLRLHTYDVTKPNQQTNCNNVKRKEPNDINWIAAQNQNMIVREYTTDKWKDDKKQKFFMYPIKSNKLKQAQVSICHNPLRTNVEAIALHPNQNMIALYSIALKKKIANLEVRQIKQKSTKKINTIKLRNTNLAHLVFSPNKPFIAVYNSKGFYIYDYKTKSKKQRLRHCCDDKGKIQQILFIPNIGSNSDNKPDLLIARKHDILALDSSNLNDKLSSYKPIIKMHELDDISSICLSHNQTILAVLKPDLVCFNYNNGQELYRGKRGSGCVLHAGNIAFNADDTKIAIHIPFKTAVYDIPKVHIESLKRLIAFVIGRNNIDTSKIPKLLLQGTCLE